MYFTKYIKYNEIYIQLQFTHNESEFLIRWIITGFTLDYLEAVENVTQVQHFGLLQFHVYLFANIVCLASRLVFFGDYNR